MRRRSPVSLLIAALLMAGPAWAQQEDAPMETLLRQAAKLRAGGKLDDAVKLATQAVKQNPKDPEARLMRAQLETDRRNFKAALADYDQAIELAPQAGQLYYLRGRVRFRDGQIEPSLVDFDKFIQVRPEAKPRQWERGISLYYAGKFDEGAQQFALYQTYYDNDVENATWRYLCMARDQGPEKAREELLPIENDRRVPMMQIYALFRGEMKPEDVLEAATAGDPTEAELHERLFYAHLYLGLFYEAHGDAESANKHITIAARDYPIGHYMWDVARIHAERFRNQENGK